jgi:hypothetical protein
MVRQRSGGAGPGLIRTSTAAAGADTAFFLGDEDDGLSVPGVDGYDMYGDMYCEAVHEGTGAGAATDGARSAAGVCYGGVRLVEPTEAISLLDQVRRLCSARCIAGYGIRAHDAEQKLRNSKQEHDLSLVVYHIRTQRVWEVTGRAGVLHLGMVNSSCSHDGKSNGCPHRLNK